MKTFLLTFSIALIGASAHSGVVPQVPTPEQVAANAAVSIEMARNTSFDSKADDVVSGGQICNLPACHPEASSTARQNANRKERNRDTSNPGQTESK